MMMVLDWPEPLNSIGIRPQHDHRPAVALAFHEQPAGSSMCVEGSRETDSIAKSVEGSIEQAYRIASARVKQRKLEARQRRKRSSTRQTASYRDAKLTSPTRKARWRIFAQALMMTYEFIYVD